jgi:hypothetical protein
MRMILKAIRLVRKVHAIQRHEQWATTDTATLQHFLDNSPTGSKLKLILLNEVNRSASNAVSSGHDLTHKCGQATGFRAAVELIQSLATVAPTETDDLEQSQSLDHLAP